MATDTVFASAAREERSPPAPQPLTDDQREHRGLIAAQLYLDARALMQMFPCPRTEQIEAQIHAYLVSIGEAT